VREYGRALWCTWRLVRRLTRDRRFDLVHGCSPPDFLLFAAWPARRRGARLVFDHHDLTPELFRARFGERHRVLLRLTLLLERLTFRIADVVIATNESYGEVAKLRGRKRPEDVFVVRNAPDLRRLKRVQPDPSLKRGAPLLIGYLGVMAEQDGVDLALQALAALRERRRDWHAVFAGEGDSRQELMVMAEALGLGELVEFVGWIGDDEIARLLSTADVCLSPEPRTPFNDASTMVKVAEYMAMARPIVAFALGETRVMAGEAAVYAEPNDVESYATRINELLDDPTARERMGAVGRARVEGSMSWEHSTVALEAAYVRALQRGTGADNGTLGAAVPALHG
jgi:glycosyltransferase involved in cell wall biosynthesis